jgi:predicted transcriptional regulator
MDTITKKKLYPIMLTPDVSNRLTELARQSYRNRSSFVAFLVEQEYNRQVANVNRIPSVNEWVKGE